MQQSNRWHFLLVVFSVIVLSGLPAAGRSNRIGLGANYWRTLDDLGGPIDRDGLSWVVTYQRDLNRLIGVQADLEWFRSGFAGADRDVFAPQAFLLAGGSLYGGLGVGILYADDTFNDAPYYAVRLGFDLEILPTVHLDINANYQFSEWEKINRLQRELKSDTLFLGAAVRIEF